MDNFLPSAVVARFDRLHLKHGFVYALRDFSNRAGLLPPNARDTKFLVKQQAKLGTDRTLSQHLHLTADNLLMLAGCNSVRVHWRIEGPPPGHEDTHDALPR